MSFRLGNSDRLVQYTGVINNQSIAHGKGRNLLMLEDKNGAYEFHHLWLDAECTHSSDEAWKTRTGKETITLSQEAGSEIAQEVNDSSHSLFDFLGLF